MFFRHLSVRSLSFTLPPYAHLATVAIASQCGF